MEPSVNQGFRDTIYKAGDGISHISSGIRHSFTNGMNKLSGNGGSPLIAFSYSSGDNYVDYEAIIDANKGLSVTIILFILLFNGSFLLMMLAKDRQRCFTNTRKMLQISLSIGDVFMAAFGLLVQAIVFFNRGSDIDCTTMLHASNYIYFILPMVHSVGIIALAVEMVVRKDDTGGMRRFFPFLVSLIPWIIGCVIAVPLVYADVYQGCLPVIPLTRYRAILATCLICPACLAVPVSLVAGMKAKPREPSSDNWMPMEGRNNAYPASVDQSNIRQVSTALNHEKAGTVIVAFIHAGCTVPYAVFLLAYTLNPYRDPMALLPYTVLSMITLWLVPFRGVLTSGVWLMFSMIQK